jgi:hypothetical protein
MYNYFSTNINKLKLICKFINMKARKENDKIIEILFAKDIKATKKTFELETNLEKKFVKYEKRKKSLYTSRNNSNTKANDNSNLHTGNKNNLIKEENKTLLIFEPKENKTHWNFYTSHQNFFPSYKVYTQDKKKKKYIPEGEKTVNLFINDSDLTKEIFPTIRKDRHSIEKILKAKKSSKSPEPKEDSKEFKKEVYNNSSYLAIVDQEKMFRQLSQRVKHFSRIKKDAEKNNKRDKIQLKEINENKFMSKAINAVQRKVSYYTERNMELKEEFVLNLIRNESNEIVSNIDFIMNSFVNPTIFSKEQKTKNDMNDKNLNYPFINSIFDYGNSEESHYLKTESDFEENIKNREKNQTSYKFNNNLNYAPNISYQSTFYRTNGFQGLSSNKSTRSRFAFSALSPINEKELDETLKNSIRNSSQIAFKQRLSGNINTDGNVETDDGETKPTKDEETIHKIKFKNKVYSNTNSVIETFIPGSELKKQDKDMTPNQNNNSNIIKGNINSRTAKIVNKLNNKKNSIKNSKDSYIQTSRKNSQNLKKIMTTNSNIEISNDSNTITNGEKLENHSLKRLGQNSLEDLDSFKNKLYSRKDSEKKIISKISIEESLLNSPDNLSKRKNKDLINIKSSDIKSNSSIDSIENKDVMKVENNIENFKDKHKLSNITEEDKLNSKINCFKLKERKRASITNTNIHASLLNKFHSISEEKNKTLEENTNLINRRNTINFSSLLKNSVLSRLESSTENENKIENNFVNNPQSKVDLTSLESHKSLKNNNLKTKTNSSLNEKSLEEKNSSNRPAQNLVSSNTIMKKLNSKIKDSSILTNSPKKSPIKIETSSNIKNNKHKNISSLLDLIKQQEKIKSKKLKKTP